MIFDFLLLGLAFYLSFPLVAGYFAHSYGRSFWLWFAIGCFLPVISYGILLLAIHLDERKTKKDELSKGERAESERLVRNLILEVERERELTEYK
ncbi:MAG: hypothetical protein AAF363_08270 [Bacteroidota bacterium]